MGRWLEAHSPIINYHLKRKHMEKERRVITYSVLLNKSMAFQCLLDIFRWDCKLF